MGGEDTVEDMFTYLMMNTPEPDEEKIRLYCNESVRHFDWLVEMGVPFNDTMYKGKHVLRMTDECLIWSGNEEVYPFREKAKPAPRGHKVAQVGELGGAKMMECLTAEALGVRFVYDAHVHNLVRQDGKIVGVSDRVFGEEKGSVRARRAVILAAGQFTENEYLLGQAPFAALDASVGQATYRAFTLGGLDVSVDGEVVAAHGSAIPGLYAIGGYASNIAQDGTGYSSGTGIGESTFFGRRAGRHSAAS